MLTNPAPADDLLLTYDNGLPRYRAGSQVFTSPNAELPRSCGFLGSGVGICQALACDVALHSNRVRSYSGRPVRHRPANKTTEAMPLWRAFVAGLAALSNLIDLDDGPLGERADGQAEPAVAVRIQSLLGGGGAWPMDRHSPTLS